MSLLTDLRVDIGDDSADPTMLRFSDAQLIQILQKSSRRINRVLSLTGTADEVAIDSSGVMTPSDGDITDLVLLQAECLIVQVDVNNDIGNGGVYAMDGEQSLDTRAKSSSRIAYLGSSHNPCAELSKALTLEQLRRTGEDGRMVW
jgi:hypothetical protein